MDRLSLCLPGCCPSCTVHAMNSVRRRWVVPVLVATFAAAAFPSPAPALQRATDKPQAASSSPSDKIAEPRALYAALNDLIPAPGQVYSVENLVLERDVIRIRLEEGKLSFFEPINGRITGAVFSGRGHVIATPREAGERRSLAQFLDVPILDQSFTSAYLRFTDSTAEELQKQLEEADAEPSEDADFSQNWGQVAKDLNPGHSVRILEDLLSTNPLPYFSATLAGGPKGPVELILDLRREEQELIGQPHVINGESDFDVWASFKTSQPDEGQAVSSTATFLPIDYEIETTITADLSLIGITTAHLRAGRSGERVVPLELSKDLAVETVMDGKTPLVFFQNAELSAREIHQRGNNFLYVVLPEPVKVGEDLQLAVSYRGNVIRDAGNGVYFVGERSAWYAHSPEWGYFTPFDLTFHWPKRLTLVATGSEDKESEEGEVRSGHWQSQTPFAVAGFNLGEYSSQTEGKSPVVNVFANRELESNILARLQAASQGPIPAMPTFIAPTIHGQQIEVQSGEMARPAAVLKQLAARIEDSIQFYEKWDGPFPFPELQVSPIPGSFGQGWPGLIYLSTLAYLPPAAQQRAGIGERAQEETRDILPFHEVAHQWWGNLTTAANYRDVWLEESMATYQALIYDDSQKPDAKRLEEGLTEYRDLLEEKLPEKSEPIEQTGPLVLGSRLSAPGFPDPYDVIVYDKGAWVMHMLRMMMRDGTSKQPDARFEAFLQSVLTGYKYKPLTTAEFEKAAEKQMTPSMDLDGSGNLRWFFDQWVRNTGIPRYNVKFATKSMANGFLVYGVLSQEDVDESFVARIPLYYPVGKGKLALLGNVVTSGVETHFHFVSRARPERLVIDPHLTVLCVTN